MLFISCFAGLLHLASIAAPPEQSFYAHPKEDIERKNQDENNAYIFQPDVNFSSHKPECSDAAARCAYDISSQFLCVYYRQIFNVYILRDLIIK